MIKTVTSATNPTVKLLAGLRSRKHREDSGLFLAEGARTALEGLRSGAVPRILAYSDAADRRELKTLSDACLGNRGACLLVTEKILAKITRKDNPQPIVAAFPRDIRVLAALRPLDGRIFVALDRVRDPGNLGTVIRTADAVAAAGLVLVGDSCDPYSPESVRAAMGSLFNVPIFAGSESEFVALAKGWPGSVVGASLAATAHYRGVKYPGAVLAVLGNEQSGLSPGMEKSCKQTVRIPIFGRPESLNLAVAAGILLYGIKEGMQDSEVRP
jgi:TrmH family RNA methyltransferase